MSLAYFHFTYWYVVLGGGVIVIHFGGYNFTFKNSEQSLCSSPFSWHLRPCFLGCLKIPNFDSARSSSNSFSTLECSFGLRLQAWIHLKWLHAVFLLSSILDGLWVFLFDSCSTLPREKIKSEQKKELICTVFLSPFIITLHTPNTDPVAFLFIFLFQTTLYNLYHFFLLLPNLCILEFSIKINRKAEFLKVGGVISDLCTQR